MSVECCGQNRRIVLLSRRWYWCSGLKGQKHPGTDCMLSDRMWGYTCVEEQAVGIKCSSAIYWTCMVWIPQSCQMNHWDTKAEAEHSAELLTAQVKLKTHPTHPLLIYSTDLLHNSDIIHQRKNATTYHQASSPEQHKIHFPKMRKWSN